MTTSCCPYISNKSHKQAQGRKWGSAARADFGQRLTHLSTMCVWSSESPSMAVHSGHLNFFRGVTCQRSTKIHLAVSAKDDKITPVTTPCILLLCKLSCLFPHMHTHVRAHAHTPLAVPPLSSVWLGQRHNSQGPNKKGLEGFCLL